MRFRLEKCYYATCRDKLELVVDFRGLNINDILISFVDNATSNEIR